MHWGYGDNDGPHTWCQMFQHANGHRQSPVDIVTHATECDPKLKTLKVQYLPCECKSMVNTGKGYQVCCESQGVNYRIGDTEYRLAQFHFHWGKTSKEGSEHTVNGTSYAAELHLVHWNSTKYETADEALAHPDGLAVIGVFIKAGRRNHHFQQLCDLFKNIRYSQQQVELHDGFDLACLLPHDLHHYWTYDGSLTTPPCYESVKWVVLMDPIEFSEDQLDAFRQLENVTEEEASHGDHARTTHNHRPPMPLGDRKIYSSM